MVRGTWGDVVITIVGRCWHWGHGWTHCPGDGHSLLLDDAGVAGHAGINLVGLEEGGANYLHCHHSAAVVKKKKKKKELTCWVGVNMLEWEGGRLMIACAGDHVVIIAGRWVGIVDAGAVLVVVGGGGSCRCCCCLLVVVALSMLW